MSDALAKQCTGGVNICQVVVDVGCGSGILSFFAAQAGARKVYGIEASRAALDARLLAQANGMGDVIEIVQGKVEEIDLPEKADVIISEPMGTLLLNERMVESFVIARDRFMKMDANSNINGKMFPSTSNVFLAPFSDEILYAEQCVLQHRAL